MKKLKSDCFIFSRFFIRIYVHLVDKSLETNAFGMPLKGFVEKKPMRDVEKFMKEFPIKNSFYQCNMFFFNRKIRKLFYEE